MKGLFYILMLAPCIYFTSQLGLTKGCKLPCQYTCPAQSPTIDAYILIVKSATDYYVCITLARTKFFLVKECTRGRSSIQPPMLRVIPIVATLIHVCGYNSVCGYNTIIESTKACKLNNYKCLLWLWKFKWLTWLCTCMGQHNLLELHAGDTSCGWSMLSCTCGFQAL